MPIIAPKTTGLDKFELNPREIESVSEVIFERVFNDSDLAEFHEIETGIDTETQIAFANKLGLLGKKSTGCAPVATDTGFTLTQKKWVPELEEFRLVHCQKQLDPLMKIFRKAKRINPDFFDLVGSQELGVIIAVVEEALKENIHTKVWFDVKGVTNATAEANHLYNVPDLAVLNSFDGLFKQIFTEVGTLAANYVAISANQQASYSAQALASDEALNIFEKMISRADDRLLSADDSFLLVTRSLAENYRTTLRHSNLGSGYLEVVEEGRPKLYFDGIEIKVRYDWDRFIKDHQNDGSKYYLPHRAILTTKSNIPIGTLNAEDLAKLDVFYDRVNKQNIIDAAYTLDAKHLEPYMTVAAY
nr:hypothetical protein [uncultured Flavobacterium sp.]